MIDREQEKYLVFMADPKRNVKVNGCGQTNPIYSVVVVGLREQLSAYRPSQVGQANSYSVENEFKERRGANVPVIELMVC